ncbi:hypothetical protein [Chelativorans sp.]|uniref:hypothetical protein n=1 Tax=Chelativorans sp. TaxID=2203393 RepID=UPI0028113CED|nr:hypothetical protein [Chelativorans sp.]
MRPLNMPAALVVAGLLVAPAAFAQTDTGPNNTRGSAPAIVTPDQRGGQRENPNNIRTEFEDLVQIRGTWAADKAACADMQPEGGDTGLYLTDTLLRWQGTTCSIRDVDAEEQSATLRALCTEDSVRRERTIGVEITGEDTLSLAFQTEGQQNNVSLTRCQAAQ